MSILQCAKNLGIRHNVSFRVIDVITGKVMSEHIGHNAATNSMLTGIAHYLKGDGVLNQGTHMLGAYVPKYISLGTMGLYNQDEDDEGLPAVFGSVKYSKGDDTDEKTYQEYLEREKLGLEEYLAECPGYGADGYDSNMNNGRRFEGLGYPYTSYAPEKNYDVGDIATKGGILYRCNTTCTGPWDIDKWDMLEDGYQPGNSDDGKYHLANIELISPSFPRARISHREIVPEYLSSIPETIDVVYSAMISTGALAQFREPGKDYIFITEAGLWSKPSWSNSGDNGLLAGYRLCPSDRAKWEMRARKDENGNVIVSEEQAAENRRAVKESIIRVGRNQVVQVVWKIQLGALSQLGGLWGDCDHKIYWNDWTTQDIQ